MHFKNQQELMQHLQDTLAFVDGRRDLTLNLSWDPFVSAVRAVAFDIDGTLTDSIGQIVDCTRRTFEHCKLPQPDERAIKAMIGKKLREGLATLVEDPSDDVLVDHITQVYRDIYAEVPEIACVKLFPGIGDMLKDLRDKGYKIAYASGKSRRGILRAMDESVLGDYCDALCAGDEVPSKPAPDMMYVLSHRLRLNTFEIAGAGDAGMDVQMFQNASCVSCAVQTGVWSGEALQLLQPNLLLPKVTDWCAYLPPRD